MYEPHLFMASVFQLVSISAICCAELADSVELLMQQLSFASPTKRLKVETLSYVSCLH